MTDSDALVAAVAERPDDDTPRLVYADWLEENGHPLRAEFIRIDCELTRLVNSPRAEQFQYKTLYLRKDELLTRHLADLIGPVAGVVHLNDLAFDRGFLASLPLEAGTFLDHAADVAAIRPRPRVRVWGAARLLGPILARPETACVAELVVQSERWEFAEEIGIDTIVALAECPHLGGLTTLDLTGCGLTDAGLDAIANSDRLPRLVDLDVQSNQITDEGVRLLATSPLFPRLRRLILGNNPLTDESAYHLTAIGLATKLADLNLRMTEIGPEGQKRLLNRFPGAVSLF